MTATEVYRPPVLGLKHAGNAMTPEEFDAIEEVDENYDYELIHGRLIVMTPPKESEVGPNELLGHWLLIYKERHPQGSALDCTLPERRVRGEDSRRRADRLIWAGLGRMPHFKQDQPTIVVEFVSEGRRDQRRDYIEKRAEYMVLGVREYWIIDRFRRVMTVVRNSPGGEQEQVVAESEIYRTALLPGFELHMSQLFAAADRFEQPE